MSSPFIIWTFRRTGGTNLGQRLFQSSKFKATEHEPFNTDRVWGRVLQNWYKNKDLNELYGEIEHILEKKMTIKHCLELMPNELNLALAELSCKKGYKHLFLYREEAKSRMLSLNYALKTNIWGHIQAKNNIVNPDVFKSSIPIDSMLKHEKESRHKMRLVYDYLSELDKPLAVSFEELYDSNFSDGVNLISTMFDYLLGDTAAMTSDFLEKTLKNGGQGTKHDYMRFPNSDKFVEELDKLPKFKLHP